MRTHRTPYWSRHAQPARSTLDVMRPSEAFAVRSTSRLDDPARWLRATLLVIALTAALAVLLGAAELLRGG